MVEQYFGKKFEAFKAMPKWEFYDYLGWGEQGDGKLFYGIYVQVSKTIVPLQATLPEANAVALSLCRSKSVCVCVRVSVYVCASVCASVCECVCKGVVDWK